MQAQTETPIPDAVTQAPAMDDAKFFDIIRHTVFGGHMTQEQVDGVNRILDYKDSHYSAMAMAPFACLLANTTWETGRHMSPIIEEGSPRYLKSKPYWPWIGYGLIQLTWEANYKRFGITNPQDALKWNTALDVLFRGMVNGMFTGKKLSDFFHGDVMDFYNSRTIVNSHDQAHIIEALGIAYYKALQSAGADKIMPTK